MNYVWEVLLLADKEGIEREALKFQQAVNPSPYLEASFEEMNTESILDTVVEVNPLYRFSKELGKLFDLNVEGMEQTREILFDLFFHYIAQLDLREGLSRQDYHQSFLHQDLMAGSFGRQIAKDYLLFSPPEKKSLCLHLLRLIKTGSYHACFRGAVKAVYPRAILYESKDRADELLVYLGVQETKEEQRRISLIKELFLPLQAQAYIYYNHHFGIIGVDETMIIDELMLF